MTVKKCLLPLLLVSLIAGCAHKLELLDHVVKLNQPYRVIKHDFDNKYGLVYSLPEKQTVIPERITEPEEKVPVSKIEKKDQKHTLVRSLEKSKTKPLSYVDIEFFNESAVVKNREETVSKILDNIKSDRYLIVGHSHGKSAIGVESLAAKRARYMSNVLFLAGIPRENIFFFSAWSDGDKDYSISKGVRVFALPETLNASQSLITGINQQRG